MNKIFYYNMNFYSKLQKYIGKVNYIGGASAAPQVRLYEFKEGGYDELITDINRLLVPDLPPIINPEILFDGIPFFSKRKAERMIRILSKERFIHPRFNELWPNIYDMILQQGSKYYTNNYRYDVKDHNNYGLIILNSIYDHFKYRRNPKGQLIKVFADSNDICQLGYSPHSNRQCKSFSGKHDPNLLHWPDMSKTCDADNAPKSKHNDTGGCGKHKSSLCCFYHKNTLVRPKLCLQVLDRDICHQSDFVISDGPIAILFKGFETLPNQGKWAKKTPFAYPEDTCDFAINDIVLIPNPDIRSKIGNVLGKIVVKYIIRELNRDTSGECVSAKIKYKFNIGNEYIDHPDKIDIKDIGHAPPPREDEDNDAHVDKRTPVEIEEAEADRAIKRYIAALKRARDGFVSEKDLLSVSNDLEVFIKEYPLPTNKEFIELKEDISTYRLAEKQLNDDLIKINNQLSKLEQLYRDTLVKKELLSSLEKNTNSNGTKRITISDTINTLVNERIPELKIDRIEQNKYLQTLQKSIRESYGILTGVM